MLEHAANTSLASAASFSDLVKAFDRVNHMVLIAEAQHWDYPMWILRLCLAAYRMGRRITMNGIVSHVIFALRGLTAGSVTATTEMRCLMLRTLDFVVRAFPAVPLQGYVDDMYQFMAAPLSVMLHKDYGFAAAVRALMDGLKKLDLQISITKSVGIASGADVASWLQASMHKHT